MAATEFAFFVFLVAGALPVLFDLDLMMGKLRRSLRARSGDFAGRQRTYPRSRGACAAGFGLTNAIVLEGETPGQSGSVATRTPASAESAPRRRDQSRSQPCSSFLLSPALPPVAAGWQSGPRESARRQSGLERDSRVAPAWVLPKPGNHRTFSEPRKSARLPSPTPGALSHAIRVFHLPSRDPNPSGRPCAPESALALALPHPRETRRSPPARCGRPCLRDKPAWPGCDAAIRVLDPNLK